MERSETERFSRQGIHGRFNPFPVDNILSGAQKGQPSYLWRIKAIFLRAHEPALPDRVAPFQDS